MTERRVVIAGLGLMGLSGCAASLNAKLKEGRTMAKIIPNYMEMKAADLPASKAFYEKAFGFAFTDYGPEYAAVEGGPVQIGIAAGENPPAPMPTFETDDLDAAFAQVKETGANIVAEIFEYPGGKRFECLDPSGNRLAVYQPD